MLQRYSVTCRMSLLGLFAAEALLLSLAIKLKIGALSSHTALGASLGDDAPGLGLPMHRASESGGLTAGLRAYLPDLRSLTDLQGTATLPVGDLLSCSDMAAAF